MNPNLRAALKNLVQEVLVEIFTDSDRSAPPPTFLILKPLMK